MAATFEISRLGIEVNLPVGATYDILLVTSSDGYPVGQISFEFGETPRKIAGIQKVAQTFMRMLFTQKGTDLLYPSLGTNFPELAVGANRTSSDAQFRSEIIGCVLDAESQSKSILNSTKSDLDSQLTKVTIKGFETTIESMSLYIQITTKAGESANIALPFPELSLALSSQA